MGKYMRRFWQPVAAKVQLENEQTLAVQVLGERLTLFRTDDGKYGLVAERCPHRRASLVCGLAEEGGLRCAYHGWKFDLAGQCVDTPGEPAASKLKDGVRIDAYPVEELGGMLFAYLGPQPAPLLPRFEFLVREEFDHEVGVTRMPCNWLQIAENSVDPQHVEFLHMRYINYRHRRLGRPPVRQRNCKKTAYEVFRYGISKKRLWEDAPEDDAEWTIGHPLLFPGNNVITPTGSLLQCIYRVPIDDTNTMVFWYSARRRPAGQAPRADVPLNDIPWCDSDGKFLRDNVAGQDMMVMIAQGDIADRTGEHLGTSDRGVALYRKTLLEQVARVERGEDPLGVVRDAAENQPWIALPYEGTMGFAFTGLTNFEYDVEDTARHRIHDSTPAE
jgi:5,5'-dehydrodivanillate O-demethylase